MLIHSALCCAICCALYDTLHKLASWAAELPPNTQLHGKYPTHSLPLSLPSSPRRCCAPAATLVLVLRYRLPMPLPSSTSWNRRTPTHTSTTTSTTVTSAAGATSAVPSQTYAPTGSRAACKTTTDQEIHLKKGHSTHARHLRSRSADPVGSVRQEQLRRLNHHCNATQHTHHTHRRSNHAHSDHHQHCPDQRR